MCSSSYSSERIRLLIHIFRKLGKSRGITADKLEEAGRDAQRQIKPRERLEILDEIYKVRRMEESYERGEIGSYLQCPFLHLTYFSVSHCLYSSIYTFRNSH